FGGENTFGGYSDNIVVKEKFVLRISHDEAQLAAVAPLLCAGITTYSPLHHWKVGPGQKVGVVGLGGLGHMAVKIAHAMGAHVVLFTTSPNKREDG
ncbi:NAD(P)-dependent alcohol dehydrogenase, partial [Salmonella enterica]|nr:NAD(P)-dependent alcohol dehydrogenase [Salmonella enterica]